MIIQFRNIGYPYLPIQLHKHISDWSNFETWYDNGEQTAFQRANKVYRRKLEEYEAPAMDESRRESLKEYADERRRELELAR